MRIWIGALGAMAVLAGSPAFAAVAASTPAGFTVTETAHVAAAPDKVFAALAAPARWWSSDHTYSRDAANLSVELRAGGCWCEKLPGGGSAEHLRVVQVQPGRLLRLRGGLGPLQAMAADGVLTWSLAAGAGGTDLKLTYAVFGDPAANLGQLSGPVDQVLGEQVARLKAMVETGKP